MEHKFVEMFEDVRHEKSLILLLSSTDPDILRHSETIDQEKSIIKYKRFSFRKITQTTNIKRASGYCFTRVRIRINI